MTPLFTADTEIIPYQTSQVKSVISIVFVC